MIRSTAQIVDILHHNRDQEHLVDVWIKNNSNGNDLVKLIQQEFPKILSVRSKWELCGMVDSISYPDTVLKDVDANAPVMSYDCKVLDSLPWVALSNKFLENESEEKEFLFRRGVTPDIVSTFQITSIDLIPKEHRDVVGATVHKCLEKKMPQQPKGIVIPIKDLNGCVVGCHVRFLNLLPHMKFTSSIPNFFTYHNFGNVVPEEFWVVEGVFDLFAMHRQGLKVLSPSSGFFSLYQWCHMLMLLKESKPVINLLLDYDAIGLKSAWTLAHMLTCHKIPFKLWLCAEGSKDPAEHFEKSGKSIKDLTRIRVKEVPEKYKKVKRHGAHYSFESFLQERNKQSEASAYSWA